MSMIAEGKPAVMPADRSKVTAVRVGDRWFFYVVPGSLRFTSHTVQFVVRWNKPHPNERKRYAVALEAVNGYEESA